METTVQSAPAQPGQQAPPQMPTATAGQPAAPLQEIIVPEEDWQTYTAYIKNKYPFMLVQASQISDLQAAEDVANGKAMRITKKNLMGGEGGQAAAFDTKHMLDNLNIPAADVPQFIEGLATQLGQFAAKNGGVEQKEDNIMENNNAQVQAQAQQMGMFEQMKAQAENVSWSRVAKGVGLVGGGVVIGKFAFGGKANPQTAEALMSAAETMSKADPKAIANALGTIGKGVVSKIFSI